MGNTNSILVIAAHPDDEILGCGGTVHRLAQAGNCVRIAIMAEGLTSRQPDRDAESIGDSLGELKGQAQRASQIVGAKSCETFNFPDNRMDSVARLDVIKKIEELIERHKPSMIFTHFPEDLNIDHRIVSECVLTACRPIPGQCVKEILYFEVPSSTEWQMPQKGKSFQPNVFIPLDEADFQAKQNALQIYAGEMRDFPHTRSHQAVEALARWRGASSGHRAAEAFVLARKIW